MNSKRWSQRGATTVEYAVIVVMTVLVLIGVVVWLMDPTEPGSLPSAYNSVGNKIGNFGLVN